MYGLTRPPNEALSRSLYPVNLAFKISNKAGLSKGLLYFLSAEMMKFKTVLETLEDCNEFPLGIDVLAELACRHTPIDRFKFIGVNLNEAILKGAYIRTLVQEDRGIPYRQPEVIGKIYYDRNVNVAWQRFCIVKELLHVVDPKWASVSTSEHLTDLIEHLCIPVEVLMSSKVDTTRAKAFIDRMADWRAVLTMIPEKKRERICQLYQMKKIDMDKIVNSFHIPREYVPVVLNDDAWDGIMNVWLTLDTTEHKAMERAAT